MKIAVSRLGDTAVLRLQGHITANNADEFERQVLEAIDGGSQRFLFVLDELVYISSAGLRVFYVAIKKLDRSRISLCGIQTDVKTVFDIVGLTTLIKVFATEAEALADMPASS